ncbi:hypothetical protein F4860DRAFT_510303 [Xylaria cubensis]|nr:hypothetical protein F4860DRAFT_510303 [Xylaria cubensis]
MADQSDIINSNPIGKAFDKIYDYGNYAVARGQIDPSPDAWNQLEPGDLTVLTTLLVAALRQLPVSHNLPSKCDRGTLHKDLLELDSTDTDRLKPLLNAVLAKKPDKEIWDAVYDAVPEKKWPSTPRHRQVASLVEQTPSTRNARSVVNSSESRTQIDPLLKEELRYMYAGISDFCKTFFGCVAGLDAAYVSVFKKCTEGRSPLFDGGWNEWPTVPDQYEVLSWFNGLVEQLSAFAEEHQPTMNRRSLVARPDQALEGGSPAKRKLDVGFVIGEDASNWSQVLVPGELKSNPDADKEKSTWHDIGRYAREVLIGQDTRRFVISFTLSGPFMRVWVFDRLGAVASEEIDINKEGKQFVYVILGFLWMNTENLGFDPTVIEQDGQRLITITKNNETEQFVIDHLMLRTSCIVGRATTCWKTHRLDDPQTFFVIKDSWQEDERREEGELLKIATEKGVENVARYYHHEDVLVRGQVDSVRDNIRKDLDISKALYYLEPSVSPTTKKFSTRRQSQISKTSQPSNAASQTSNATSQTSSATNRKRASDQTDAPLPPSKRRSQGSKAQMIGGSSALSNRTNRTHRRVVLRDYGKPIYEASSRVALLKALEGCIRGHKSLRDKAGILHRDISVNNLMINEDTNNLAPFSFLIDLDLAIEEDSRKASGAKSKTGTRAFMAIGALQGQLHSFMDDLESFFWVLLWICINYQAGGKMVKFNPLDTWNYMADLDLIHAKLGVINKAAKTEGYFTPYYQPLIRWVNELRKVVFPDNTTWVEEDQLLYARMIAVLQEAQKDPDVLTEHPKVLANK